MDLDEKILKVKTEIPDFLCNDYVVIKDGCEKIVIITENKKVVCFLNDIKNIDKYTKQIDFLQTLSRTTNVVIPTISHISQDYGFYLCEYVAGQRITPEFIYRNVSKARYIGQSIGKFLKVLHSLPIEIYNMPSPFISDVVSDMIEGKQILFTCLSSDEYKQVENFLMEYYKLISGHNAECIVHGDFHYNNIYWDDGCNCLGVIDFGESCVGDPAVDFMWFINQMPKEFLTALFDSYEIEENTIKRSIMFDRLYGLYDMIENRKGDPRKPSFAKGYKRFFT